MLGKGLKTNNALNLGLRSGTNGEKVHFTHTAGLTKNRIDYFQFTFNLFRKLNDLF